MNWISPTGFSPCAAMPTHRPLIRSSDNGVSNTRSAPKRCCRPAVARNTPPFTPTSSPNTTTSGSSASARARARLTESTSVVSGIGPVLDLLALAGVSLRQLCIQIVEHRLRRARAGRQVALGGGIDARLAFGPEPFLVGFAPSHPADEKGAQPCDRLLLPVGLDLFGRPVTRGIVGRGVVAQAIGEGFDEPRTFAGASRGER